MNKNTIFLLISVFLLIVESTAQNKNTQVVDLKVDSMPSKIFVNQFQFENVNKIPHYFKKSQVDDLNKFERQRDYKRQYELLDKYVRNFGIENFYSETRMIWRLAKLTEMFGDDEDAKSLYRLVLRHHHDDINLNEIELYYDSLNRQETSRFVPIDYYYEMVEHRKLIDTLMPPKGVLLNMGSLVNSRGADYGPSLSKSNGALLFTSQREELGIQLDERKNEDLYISYPDTYGTWSRALAMEGINSPYNEGSAVISADGLTLYFSRCDCPSCYGDCDLFSARFQDSVWMDIQNLGINVNSLSWDSHPALSHGEDTLFFASDRLGGFGMSDIYFSVKNNESWTTAKNMGPIINTRGNEVSPFYHAVFDVMYFSSNGQLYNFGAYDIYKSYKIGENWSEPINIGPLVNGKGSEFYFTIDSESKNLYYARSTSSDLKKLDLYSFPLPMGARPDARARLIGSLRDSLTGQPFGGIVSVIDMDDGIEVAPKYVKRDGTFEFDLIDQRNYLLVIQGDDFFRIEQAFYMDGYVEINKVTEPLLARIKFESVEFDNGKSEIKPEMYSDLNKLINFLYDNPEFKLKISGHTDSQGSPETNLKLSKERAENIRDYLVIFAGILEVRVDFEGYGSEHPLIEERSDEDRSINRRVEFQIYREGIEVQKVDN
jgi:outer membrane protein OmpA-like peptidoglycan-associated protein